MSCINVDTDFRHGQEFRVSVSEEDGGLVGRVVVRGAQDALRQLAHHAILNKLVNKT